MCLLHFKEKKATRCTSGFATCKRGALSHRPKGVKRAQFEMFSGCFSSLNILSWNLTFYVLWLYTDDLSSLCSGGCTTTWLFLKFTVEHPNIDTARDMFFCPKCPFLHLVFLLLLLYFKGILRGISNGSLQSTKKKSMKTYLIKTPKERNKKRIQSHCYIMYVPPYHRQPQFSEGCHLRWINTWNRAIEAFCFNFSSAALKCQKHLIKRHSVWTRQHFTSNIQRETQPEVKATLNWPHFNSNLILK